MVKNDSIKDLKDSCWVLTLESFIEKYINYMY